MADKPTTKPGPTPEPPKAPAPPATPPTFEELHAAVIREKVQVGLAREQAIDVVKAQLAHDATLAAAAAAASPAK
ncbi:MAG: hypothetical protein IT580_23970 [Verrucomicrobiales bacterium]|nr:hypothetical protein [Verrucomicrobiales bacterium]